MKVIKMYAQDATSLASTEQGQAAMMMKPHANEIEEMDVRMALADDGAIYIYHDRPFGKELSWLEYNMDTDSLDFIMDDGDSRNFGIPVDRKYNPYMQNMHTLGVVLVKDMTTYVSGEVLPLIVHKN